MYYIILYVPIYVDDVAQNRLDCIEGTIVSARATAMFPMLLRRSLLVHFVSETFKSRTCKIETLQTKNVFSHELGVSTMQRPAALYNLF